MITIPINLIKAAIPCAATKEVRRVLNGALFEWTAIGQTLRVVSTDGSIMSCFAVHIPTCAAPDMSVIIPIETLKAAAKVKAPALELEEGAAGAAGRLGGLLFTPIDGRFPEYRRVIPTALSGEAGSYDAALLVRAADALRAYYGAKNGAYTFTQNGAKDSAVMHNGTNDALVVVMPWRSTKGCDVNKAYCGFAA